jgi:hypothetical protein
MAGNPRGQHCMSGKRMWGHDDELRPSKQLADLLSGKIDPKDANPNILPSAQFAIWQAATQICGMGTKEQRQKALTKIPETIRPFVEREIKRIWPNRNNL